MQLSCGCIDLCNGHRYYTDDELAQLEMLPWHWMVEEAVLDFDDDTLRLLDEGNAT